MGVVEKINELQRVVLELALEMQRESGWRGGWPTCVWTMLALCVRNNFTVWKMSTTPSERMRSSTLESAQNTPVRPTPSLEQKTNRKRLLSFLGPFIPKSDQFQISPAASPEI